MTVAIGLHSGYAVDGALDPGTVVAADRREGDCNPVAGNPLVAVMIADPAEIGDDVALGVGEILDPSLCRYPNMT